MQKVTVFAGVVGAIMMSSAYAQTPAPAPAPTPDAAPQVTQPAPADDPNEIICRAGEPVVGSRFPTGRVCHTRKQWDQIRQDSQEQLYHQQMNRGGTGSGG